MFTHSFPSARRSSKPTLKRLAFVVAAAAGVAALTLTSVTAASAAGAAQTVFVTDALTGSSVTGYIKPTAPTGSNFACLTASSNTAATPIPGCATTAINTNGSGALRLTSANNTLEGGVGATQSVPISKGLDATFDSYQYGGNGADGIAFYLAVTDPYNPQVPAAIGQAGGSLGYSATGTSAGLAHGYLGLGLDNYGNYLSSSFDGTGCSSAPGSTTQPKNVSVRGPGNGTAGYCVLPGYNAALGANPLEGTTRANSDVPVEVIINPSTSATTSGGFGTKLTSVSVPAKSYAIVFKTLVANATQTVVSGSLPDLRAAAYTGMVDSSWYDPATGLPYKLTYGWVASTGGSNDVHEVNYLNAQTVNGPVPVLTATSNLSTATPSTGSSATLSVNPTVTATGGAESAAVRVTTTFPAGITPNTYPGTDYTCTIGGQTETCTYTGTTAAGTSLPALVVPFTAAGGPSATPLSISSVVASTDATAVTTTSTVTISKIPTTTTLSLSPTSPTYGSSETFTATVSPSAGTGTVAFRDTTTGAILCAAATLTNGIATCTTTTAGPAGSHAISATYSGDTLYASSTGTTTAVTQSAPSTITVAASPATVQYGSSSTLSASGVPAGATGTVSFVDAGGNTLCTSTAATQSCTTSSALAAGGYSVTALYSGDANFAAETSTNTAALTVDKATATIIDTVNGKTSDSTAYGTVATLATQGFAAGATGAITFTTTGGALLCTAILPSTSCTTSTTLDSGAYDITANYLGDANYAAESTLFSAQLTVTKAPAPTLITTVDTPTVPFGSTGIFDVSGAPTGGSGTISYTAADGTVLCTATLPATSCDSSTGLLAGPYAVTATYSGDANHTGGTSAAISFTVAKAAVGITATVNGATSDSVSFGTAAILDVPDLPANAGGSLTFTDANGTVLCTANVTDLPCATATSLGAGDYAVTASWTGDANYQAATATAALTVTRANANLTATVNGGPNATTIYGTSAALNSAGLDSTATGTIEYREGAAVLCSVDLADGTGCEAAANLASSVHTITAYYLGDANHAPATSASVTLTVAKASPVLTDTVNGSPTADAPFGSPAILDVAAIPTGATGTIQYTDQGGNILCTVTLPATSCTTAADLVAGPYNVTATYQGDVNFSPATTTGTADLTITKASVPAFQSTVDDTLAATITHGAIATLTTTGLPVGATGTIAYTAADGTVLCTATLPDTSCTTAQDLPGGTYDVTPVYSGDSNHQPANGPRLRLSVLAQKSVIVATATANTTGTTTTLTATGIPDGATGTITFTLNGTVLCTATLPDMSCTTTALAPGTHTVLAAYSGDASYAASEASVTVTVPTSSTALAFTGSQLSIPLILSIIVALLAFGLLLLAAARRRRGQAES